MLRLHGAAPIILPQEPSGNYAKIANTNDEKTLSENVSRTLSKGCAPHDHCNVTPGGQAAAPGAKVGTKTEYTSKPKTRNPRPSGYGYVDAARTTSMVLAREESSDLRTDIQTATRLHSSRGVTKERKSNSKTFCGFGLSPKEVARLFALSTLSAVIEYGILSTEIPVHPVDPVD